MQRPITSNKQIIPKWFTRKWRWIIVFYGILLLISHGMMSAQDSPRSLPPGQKRATIEPEDRSATKASTVTIAYDDIYSGTLPHPPVALLLHGNPGTARQTFAQLIPHLTTTNRIIAPDLPGFGASSRSLDNYGIYHQSRRVLALLDQLHIDRVHVVAHGLGGGIALNLFHLAPQRMASLALISSTGVQELALLGNHHLNRGLYGFQLGLLWLVRHGTPHMGLYDHQPYNLPYARALLDSDQRPLRGYLSRFEAPMLIVHGNKDPLVPLAVALEHHRLVPQSKLSVMDGGHRIINRHSAVATIGAFIDQVGSQAAPHRHQADAERLREARRPLETATFPPYSGIALVTVMVLIALATLISEDLACIGAGLMAARGIIGMLPAIGASFLGILLGDMLLYLSGKWLGRPALNHPPLSWLVKPVDIDRASQWFAAKGPVIILSSRFLPGSRLPTYVAAGMLNTGFWRFTLYFSVAALLWTPLLVGLAAVVGNQMIAAYTLVQKNGVLIVAGTVLTLWLVVKLLLPIFSYRGRRLLLSAWRRKTRWEFWHPYLFYIPVICYVAFLAVRHRSLTVFSASNPGIPQSGFVRESKSGILNSLTAERHRIARYRLIDGNVPFSEKMEQALNFIGDAGISYPVVLKPDVGQRGAGVAILKNETELESQMADSVQDMIIQEYVGGAEFGVFYIRYPGHKSGHIFSITDKRLLTLVGDGKSTLERLILADERAVCMAPYHFKNHYRRLYDVPLKGEKINLVEVGTHCRGALFLDGMHVKTPALETAIDRLSKGFSGFYFGRYDIRTPSIEDFKKGRNFKVIELNGVTSEATHIYHPGTRLWRAYLVLMRQWKMAYEIGALNRNRGIKPESFTKLAHLLFETIQPTQQ